MSQSEKMNNDWSGQRIETMYLEFCKSWNCVGFFIFTKSEIEDFWKQAERKTCRRDSGSHCPVIWRFAIWYWVLSVTATELLSSFAAIPSGKQLERKQCIFQIWLRIKSMFLHIDNGIFHLLQVRKFYLMSISRALHCFHICLEIYNQSQVRSDVENGQWILE